MAERILKPCYGSIDLIGAIRQSHNPLSVAAMFSDAMVTAEQTREAHFAEAAQAIHTALDVMVATDASIPSDKRNKRFAWSLFTNQNLFSATLEAMADSEHEFVRDQANAFLDVGGDDKEMRGVKSTLRTQCSRTYSDPAIMDTLCCDVADFSRINYEPMSIYICIPGNLIDVHFRYVRLLLNYFLSEIERGGLRRFS